MRVVIRIQKRLEHVGISLARLPTKPRWLPPNMARSAQNVDATPACRRTHCRSRLRYCIRPSCVQAIASRLERRHVGINTHRNILNPVLDNIEFITEDIRHKCNCTAWKGKTMTRARSRYNSAMDRTIAPSPCSCKTCLIDRADRKIQLLSSQHTEARRYLDVLKQYRREHDLDAPSAAGSAGR